MFKYRLPSLVKFSVPKALWKVKTTDKVLYLTFDDGPHPTITHWVLNELNKYNAKATFFCVGENVTKYPTIYQQILAQGHTTGNHTYNHLNGFKTPAKKYLNNIEKAQSVIHSKLFRPPYGRINPFLALQLKNRLQIVMWSVLSCDYKANLNINESLLQLKKSVPGDILVFHDSEKAFNQLQQLLPEVLQYFTNLNFTFKALPQHGNV
jgi:peptidoglycan/xylan/chitin deacetylase (PgdA/CDA1 family)